MSAIFIPQIITTTNGREHAVDLESYQFVKERKVKLIGEIDAPAARAIVSQLDYLDGKGDGDIRLIINSPGGSVSDGLMIYDTIKYGLHCDVSTVAAGMAASFQRDPASVYHSIAGLLSGREENEGKGAEHP